MMLFHEPKLFLVTFGPNDKNVSNLKLYVHLIFISQVVVTCCVIEISNTHNDGVWWMAEWCSYGMYHQFKI
jgi:hypothetical protein